jgi:hypothetical protein
MMAPLSTADELDVAVHGADQAVYFKRREPKYWVPSQTGWDMLTTSVPDASVDTAPFWSANSMLSIAVLLRLRASRVP